MTASEMKGQSKDRSKRKGGAKTPAKGVKGAKKAAPGKIVAQENEPSDAQGTTDADINSALDQPPLKGTQPTAVDGCGVGSSPCCAGGGGGRGSGAAGAGPSCACPVGAACASCGALTAPAGEVATCCARCAAAQGKRLLRAAHDGCAKEVRQLLEDGADPNYTCDNEWTALHRAVANGHAEAASALLKGGAALEATTRGFSALHLAAHHDRSGRCAFLLVAAGADANRAAALGRTPLHYAAEAGNVAALQELLAAGACRTAKDAKGWTPADVAKNATVRKILHKL